MDNNFKDILSNLNKDVEQAKLLDYLNKQLSADDAHDIEKAMADDPFVNDAVEGLHAFNNKKDLNVYVQQLNDDLQKKITKKKSRKEKRRLKDEPWIYFTIVLLLILIIVGYVLIKRIG